MTTSDRPPTVARARRALLGAALRTVTDAAGATALARARAAVTTGPPVAVHVRRLRPHPAWIRPGTTDAIVLIETFLLRLHLPPRRLRGVRRILDLGANIGLTAADLLARFPQARLWAVEMDPASSALARRNLEPWAARAQVVTAAVWSADGEVAYVSAEGEEWAAAVTTAGDRRTRAISLATLVAEAGPLDYVKVDVEGTERELLADGTGWAQAVRCLSVEVHAPYTRAACIADLRRLGFRARRSLRSRLFVVAHRPGRWAA